MSNYPTDIKNALFTLGFETTAPKTLQELNKRYHMLALKHHPDKNINDDETFKNINSAHKIVKEYFFDAYNNDETDLTFNKSFNSLLIDKNLAVAYDGGTKVAPWM